MAGEDIREVIGLLQIFLEVNQNAKLSTTSMLSVRDYPPDGTDQKMTFDHEGDREGMEGDIIRVV